MHPRRFVAQRMRHQRFTRTVTVIAAAGWSVAVLGAAVGLIEGRVSTAILLAAMVLLSATITASLAAVILRGLPPVAAAWYLGFRESEVAHARRAKLRVVHRRTS